MGLFDNRSEQEKADEREAKNAEKKHRAWLETPVGQATTAFENNAGFFEIELELGTSKRDVSFGFADSGTYKRKGNTGLLSEIEDVGWTLFQAGYYFMPTGEVSRDRMLATGQNVAIRGKSMGVYLFKRNPDK